MASERTFPRWLLRTLAAIILLTVVVSAGLAWVLGTNAGARMLVSAALPRSGLPLHVENIEGSISGPLRFGQIDFDKPEQRVSLHGVRLDWMPSDLLRRQLHIASLRIERVVVVNKIDTRREPPHLPDNIALPLRLAVDDIRIGSGELGWGPLNVVKAGPLAASLEFDGTQYRLHLKELTAGSDVSGTAYATRMNGSASLSATKPYPLEARIASMASASVKGKRIGADGEIRLDGSLEQLHAAAALDVNGAKVEGKALLRPFSAQSVASALLKTNALDLASLDGALPKTALDIDIGLPERGNGTLAVTNRAAGDLARHALPISSLRMAIARQGDAFDFPDMDIRLGDAGRLVGNGSYANGTATLRLATERLDLHGIDSRLRATALSGEARLRHAEGVQDFDIHLVEPGGKQPVALIAQGAIANEEVRINRLELRAGSGNMTGSARMQLAGTQAFDLRGALHGFRLQDFGRFPQLPALTLSGDFSVGGKREPQLEADMKFSIRDSTLAGQALEGEGEAQVRGERLAVPALRLVSGANRLALQGKLAEGDAQIAFTLDAPRLAQLGQEFDGAVQAAGTIRGTLAKPRIAMQWTASKLRAPGTLQVDATQGKLNFAFERAQSWLPLQASADAMANGLRIGGNDGKGGTAVASLAAKLQFGSAPASPLQLMLRGDGIDSGAVHAARLSMDADGTTGRHAMRTVFDDGRQSWDVKASGGLARGGADLRWQGSIDAFEAKGRFNARLAAPSPLLVSRQRLLLERFLIDTAGGRIALDHLERNADGVVTRGRIDRFALSPMLAMLEPAPPVRTDLLLDADWDLHVGDVVAGSVSLRRNSGDVTVLGPASAALGLQTLAATMRADGGKLSLQADARGSRLGIMAFQAGMELGHGLERWKVAASSPFSGRGHIDIPSIAWIAPLLSPALVADGRLQSDVMIGGTPEAPELSGRINGDALRVALGDLGIDLRQGMLQGEFNGERLQLQRLSFRGGDGDVTVSGPVNLGAGAMAADLALAARRFAVLNRADRRIVVSGDSRIVLQDKHLKINGGFTVDNGFIDLGRADRPQLSDDVVIVGRERKRGGKTVATVDVTVGLGDGVALKGRGLDAQLVGKVRVTSEPGERLQANGTLSIAKGTYTAYGRELSIEQGSLRFAGAIDNPALDIVAMRRGQEVEAGVSVRGTVLAPRVTLVSEPVVPDAEKLSWLVLGHGLASGSGESDLGALQSAAGALLSEGAAAGVQSRIASAFGLDTLSVGKSQDNLQQRIVTIGKQISSHLYVSYQQGLENAGSVVQLRYTLSQRLSLEAEAGVRSALSLFYNIAFD